MGADLGEVEPASSPRTRWPYSSSWECPSREPAIEAAGVDLDNRWTSDLDMRLRGKAPARRRLRTMNNALASSVLLGVLALMPACGDTTPRRDTTVEEPHALLAEAGEIRLDPSDSSTLPGHVSDAFDALHRALEKQPKLEAIVVVQPDEGEALAGDARPPRFLWRDPAEAADTWWIHIRFGQPSEADLRLLVLGGMPAEAALDPFSSTLHAWTPSPGIWSHLVKHATGAPAVLTLVGFAADAPGAPLSQGSIDLTVSDIR